MADSFEDIRGFIRGALVERSLPSLAVAVVKDGAIVWQEGFGWADREARRPADEHTPYSVASVSKPITATGLMTLVKAGKLDLDRPVNDYLGAGKLVARVGDARKATVRAVANHSSGLPLHYQFYYEDEPWTRPSMDESLLRYGNLVTPSGKRCQYSNLGYGVLDHIIARLSGLGFAEFLRREVFLPLGMTHSAIGVGPGLAPYAAVRYGTDQAPIPFYVTDHPGGSEVYASAHDLARFCLFHLKARLGDQKPILTDDQIDEMHRATAFSGPGGYGVGFFEENRDGVRVVSHSGGMGGVATNLQIFPERGIATVALANARDALPFEVSEKLAALMIPGWQPRPLPTPTKPAPFKVPAGLVGTWRGTLATYSGDVAVKLVFRPDGEVQARFGRQLTALVNHPRMEDGAFVGELQARIGTPDTDRYPYTVTLVLNPARDRLSGAAIAVGDAGPRVRNALSAWIELKREAAGP
jgi:CubicO group peptidase (beta-lactamase class C family)